MRYYRLYIVLLIIVFAVANPGFAQFMSTEKIVSSRTMLSVDKLRPGDSFEVAVKATVKKGYHIGAHDKDALYPAKLTLSAPKGISFSSPKFPKGERKAFAFAPKEKIPVYEGTFVIKAKGTVAKSVKPGSVTITSKLETQGCKGDQCYPPEISVSTVKVKVVEAGVKVSAVNAGTFTTTASGGDMVGKLATMSPLGRFLWLYVAGLLLAFTPCVYPMIPVTLGFFSNQSESKKNKVIMLAGTYVLGIALTYSLLGTLAAVTGGVFGSAMQLPSVQIGIAIILVALALSMFGFYELQAPSFIQSRASGRGGVLGALVMGLIFGIVAAPCAGPVVLSLMTLVARIGSPIIGFSMFFALALGIGTPLFFLAAFSAKMPVPGMWMVTVKKVAGFLLLGMAAYFLLPLLPDTAAQYLIPIIVIAGGLYLGFFEQSLRSSRAASSLGKVGGTAALVIAVIMATPKPSAHIMHWEPYSVAKVAKAGKPVMIDFTAKWCAACKELEHGPFSDPKVIKATEKLAKFRVDATDRNNKKMLEPVKRYKVHGLPTIVFVNSSGKEVKSARIEGYVDSKEMIKRIKMVK